MFGKHVPPSPAAPPPPQSPSSSHEVEASHDETASPKYDPQYDPRDVIPTSPADVVVGVSEDVGRAVVGRGVGAGLGGAADVGGSDVGSAVGIAEIEGAYVGKDVGGYVGPVHNMSAKHMSPSGQSLPVLPK